MTAQTYAIEVESDFLDKLARANPVLAISELIWNALDADSHSVSVTFAENDLGSMETITIRDDGHGLTYADAPALFGKLGGSWKAVGAKTKHEQRFLHGKDGNGRFRAFALGSHAEWEVTYNKHGTLWTFTIMMSAANNKRVTISDETPAEEGKPRGVRVQVSSLHKNFEGLKSPTTQKELTEIFALYLSDYKSVSILVDGQALNPASAIASRATIDLDAIKDEGVDYPVTLEIVEWHSATIRCMQLCNEHGFPLLVPIKRFHVGGFQFSAYLKSTFFSKLQSEGRIELAEMLPPVADAENNAYERIKDHFRNRASDTAKARVEEWKEKDIYPYKAAPRTQVEVVERQVFDIVAVNVAQFVPDFDAAPSKTKALHLRLLRQAIEKSPNDLQLIFDEVLKLPKRKQEELASLLRDVSLGAIISAAKTVSDRLKFLTGLEAILFDSDKKKVLKERSQLHKIVEQNCWLFGEQYNLSVSDQSLTEVLKKHREAIGHPIVIDDPVTHISQQTGIVDLMLTRASKNYQPNTTSHLVVELKAPKVKIDRTEIGQIEGYAFSVAEDERFVGRDVRWEFWAISDDYGPHAKHRIQNTAGMIHQKDNISIFVKTWAQVLDENRARLQFFQEKLEFQANKESALNHLKEQYSSFLEGVIVQDAPIIEFASNADDVSLGEPKLLLQGN